MQLVSALQRFLEFELIHLGTARGFRIYHTDPFSKIFSSDDANVAIIEMLFSTSLVALIKSPRHLVIQNTKVCSRLDFASHKGNSVLMLGKEIIDNMRAYVPFGCPRCATQPETTCCCIGGRDISVRHLEYDASLYNCDITKLERNLRTVAFI